MKPITTKDGSNTLFSKKFGETYHSIHGAKTEALHVFVQASDIVEHLNSQRVTHVLEIGFGVGLNFLLSADLALEGSGALNYHAYELDPPNADQLENLGYRAELKHPGLIDLAANALVESKNSSAAHYQNSEPYTGKSNVSLKISPLDISQSELKKDHYDCIYLDAFSPEVNPECWDESSLSRYFCTLRSGGNLCTYSSKGSLRRGLQAVGFHTIKLPGPPGKREMLKAVRP